MAEDYTPEALTNYKGYKVWLNTYTKRGRFGVCALSNVIVWTSLIVYKLTHRNKDK